MQSNIGILAALAVASTFLTAPARAGEYKSARECNDELRARKSELTAAGISLHDFMQQCWWHSKPGAATAVDARRHPESRPVETTTVITTAKVRLEARRNGPTPIAGSSGRPRALRSATWRPGPASRWSQATAPKPKTASRPLRLAAAAPVIRRKHKLDLADRRVPGRRIVSTRYDRRDTRAVAIHAKRAPQRFASRLDRRPSYAANRRTAALAGLFNGQQAWVHSETRTPQPAVVLDTAWRIGRDTTMQCWSQPVVFWNSKDGARRRQSRVCQAAAAPARPIDPTAATHPMWFIDYK